jgi:hypothetical protein
VDGTSEVTVGAIADGLKYVKLTADDAGPPETVVNETRPEIGVGAEAVMHRTSVDEMYVMVIVQSTPATETAVTSAALTPRNVPVIVTTVPPVIGPDAGVKVVILGTVGIMTGPLGPVYSKPTVASGVLKTPPVGDDTVTGDLAIGLETAAVVQVMSDAERAVNVAHGTLTEMLTVETSPRSDPRSVITVPPAVGPETGSIDETTGAVKVNNVGLEPVPVETVETTAGPVVRVPAGATPATQSMWVALRQVNGAQVIPARDTVKMSAAESPKPVPVIATVDCSTLPMIVRDTAVTLGAAA